MLFTFRESLVLLGLTIGLAAWRTADISSADCPCVGDVSASDKLPDSTPYPIVVPDPVTEWVQVNPLPTLLATEEHKVLVINQPFRELLAQTKLGVADFLTEHTDKAPAATSNAELWERLKSGECVVKRIVLPEDRHFTTHIAKLTVSAGSFLCCMLMPSEDPSHARFSGILNDIACFILEIDLRGNISYINDQLLEHLGYTPRERNKLTHLRQVIVDFREGKLSQQIEDVDANGPTHFRTQFRHKDGTALAMEISIVVSQAPDNSLYLVTARNITSQLEHEGAIREALVQAERKAGTAVDENHRLRAQLERDTADTPLIFESEAFTEVMRQIRLVSPTDATVLITGETGTGKELIATTIHTLSRRAERPFVTVDCGSLPPELIESELFGYRKGAFTGATKDRKGRFELADGGTIFLDEIGELPLLMQTRLLRVLQEGEFMPVGATKPVTVDIRVIAATNHNLPQQIKEGTFRRDLFYRLNVFPIRTIPLRDRSEDISPLIRHFVTKFNDKFGKEISGIDDTTLERIREYAFPGNVRELENMVERAFIISSGETLPLALPQQQNTSTDSTPVLDLFDGTLTEFLSFEEYQRKYIQLVLDSTGGKVSGKGGAAEILQIHPQTLFSKMRKLGIRR